MDKIEVLSEIQKSWFYLFFLKKILFCFVLANYLGACPEMCLIHPARGVLIKFNLLQHCIKFRGYKCIKALLVY